MDSTERRKKIIDVLTNRDDCISANSLAGMFGVTRQIIVSDIALLRANGYSIVSTTKGYMLKVTGEGNYISVVCKHPAEKTILEFYAVVDNGAIVENVIVDHPIYGQISADLNIRSRFDAEEFVEKAKRTNASQLCDLTDGIHIHMIKIPDEKAGERIIASLRELGILVEE